MLRRSIRTLTFALGLALALAQPLAGRAVAHPAAPSGAHALTLSSGKIAGPYVDLTLHQHYILDTLSAPTRMGMDAQGNLYISDDSAQKVYMYNSSDSLVRTFGSGIVGTGNDSFNYPEGVVVTGGVVYVDDYFNGLIQTFNQSSGAFINQFSDSHLGNPLGLALGSNGTLYATDDFNNDVVEFSTSGTYLGSFGSTGTGAGQFVNPRGIAASPYGPLYVTDATNKNVQEFTLGGGYVTGWGHSSFSGPDGIAVDRAGMVYVVAVTA
jgi:DNA-binding beta-propeller fold protein YncE